MRLQTLGLFQAALPTTIPLSQRQQINMRSLDVIQFGETKLLSRSEIVMFIFRFLKGRKLTEQAEKVLGSSGWFDMPEEDFDYSFKELKINEDYQKQLFAAVEKGYYYNDGKTNKRVEGLGIKIESQDVKNIKTVRQLIDYLEEKLVTKTN